MYMEGTRVRVKSSGPDRWVGLQGRVQRVIPAGEGGFDFERTRVEMDDGGAVAFTEDELEAL